MSEPLPDVVLSLAEEYDLVFKEAPESATGEQAERDCDRLLLALGAVRAEMAANQRSHDLDVQRLTHWLERVNRTPSRKEAWLLSMIEAVAPFVPRYGKKSRELPHGEIAWKRRAARLVVENPAASLAWAKLHLLPVVEVQETVPHAALVEAWKTARHRNPDFVPPGCKVEEAEERFYVSPKEVG